MNAMNAVNAVSAVSPVIDIEYQKLSSYHDQKSSKLAADRGVKWTAMDRQSCRNYRSIMKYIYKFGTVFPKAIEVCRSTYSKRKFKHYYLQL